MYYFLFLMYYQDGTHKPVDEGMTTGPSIFAYLVFGPGGTSTEGITRPMKLIAWRGPRSRLAMQGEDSKEEV
jgi:hypothetical protein